MRIKGAKWNGERCIATRGTVEVGRSDAPASWCADRVGDRIECLQITYGGDTFYIADDDLQGTEKVLDGGGPFSGRGHRSIPVDDESTFYPQDGCKYDNPARKDSE